MTCRLPYDIMKLIMSEGVNRLRATNYDRKRVMPFIFCTCGQRQTLSIRLLLHVLLATFAALFRTVLIENDFLKVGFDENV